MFVLFAVAAAEAVAFIGQTAELLCGVVKGKTTDWMYKDLQHFQYQTISVSGMLSSDCGGRCTTNGSSLIINQVKASDAGIYLCGHGGQLYHTLNLSVSGMRAFCF